MIVKHNIDLILKNNKNGIALYIKNLNIIIVSLIKKHTNLLNLLKNIVQIKKNDKIIRITYILKNIRIF